MKASKEIFPTVRSLKKMGPRLNNRTGKRLCNICAEAFKPRTVFDRYCPNCKNGSEMLKFYEWLPEMSPAIQEKLSA
jgi:hypothetical protein